MGFLYFLGRKKFYKHLGFAILITIIIFWLAFGLLRLYTSHGKTLVVPDFYGATLKHIQEEGLEKQFTFVVMDSVYDPSKEKGMIIQQDPLPYSNVKKHRKVYITIVAKMPEKVIMPDLVDLTLRQALVTLKGVGLKVELLTYVPHFAENAVLEQRYQEHQISMDTMIDKGTKIELVIGDGYKRNNVPVTLLIGRKQKDARRMLLQSSFNIGNEYFLDGRDTTHARVYKQEPSWDADTMLSHGTFIDLWYRSDELFDFDEYLNTLFPDTTQVDNLRVDPDSEIIEETEVE